MKGTAAPQMPKTEDSTHSWSRPAYSQLIVEWPRPRPAYSPAPKAKGHARARTRLPPIHPTQMAAAAAGVLSWDKGRRTRSGGYPNSAHSSTSVGRRRATSYPQLIVVLPRPWSAHSPTPKAKGHDWAFTPDSAHSRPRPAYSRLIVVWPWSRPAYSPGPNTNSQRTRSGV